MKKNPNILFIMTDQYNEGCFSAYGHPDVKTPNLDRLIQGGVGFRSCYSQSAVCQPSRTSFLTGQYLHTHGILHNARPQHNILPRSRCTGLARHLKTELNYRTGAFGKLHIGSWQNEAGFEKIVTACDAIEGEPDYHLYLKQKGLFELYVPERLQCSDDYKLRFMAGMSQIPTEHSGENFTADSAMSFIGECTDKDDPFFCWLTFERPHCPHTPPFDFPIKYDPAKLTLPEHAPERFELKPFHRRPGVENAWKSYVQSEEELRRALAAYYSLISLIDYNIGRVVEFLEKKKLLEDTIIIFSADHGDFAGHYGMLGKNALSVDMLYRTPYVWYWKGHFVPDRVYELTESIDMYPTLCRILDIPIPATVQGDEHTNALFVQDMYTGKEAVFYEGTTVKCVRTREFKMSFSYEHRPVGELYDLCRDPYEQVNLFNNPQFVAVRADLTERLLGWYMRTEMPEVFCNISEHIPETWRWHSSQRNARLKGA